MASIYALFTTIALFRINFCIVIGTKILCWMWEVFSICQYTTAATAATADKAGLSIVLCLQNKTRFFSVFKDSYGFFLCNSTALPKFKKCFTRCTKNQASFTNIGLAWFTKQIMSFPANAIYHCD